MVQTDGSCVHSSGSSDSSASSYRPDDEQCGADRSSKRTPQSAGVEDPEDDPLDRQRHVSLCPLGRGSTRWYVCRRHPQALVFQAGSGQLDSVANSCPVCGGLSSRFTDCACDFAPHPLDRASRPGRRIRRRTASERPTPPVSGLDFELDDAT